MREKSVDHCPVAIHDRYAAHYCNKIEDQLSHQAFSFPEIALEYALLTIT